MPHIFTRRNSSWSADKLTGTRRHLVPSPLRLGPEELDRDVPSDGRLLVRHGADGQWVLIVRGDARTLHNGQPVTTGIRLLEHGDAIAAEGGAPIYFSAEELARVEPFAGARATCARCRGGIVRGQSAVKCPRCGVFHHEGEERNCFTYAPTCALCPQPTALNAELQWTPQTL